MLNKKYFVVLYCICYSRKCYYVFFLLITQDGFKAFEEKVCVKSFPHADQPGFDVADTTVEILLDLTR